jgi:hypothetical protein
LPLAHSKAGGSGLCVWRRTSGGAHGDAASAAAAAWREEASSAWNRILQERGRKLAKDIREASVGRPHDHPRRLFRADCGGAQVSLGDAPVKMVRIDGIGLRREGGVARPEAHRLCSQGLGHRDLVDAVLGQGHADRVPEPVHEERADADGALDPAVLSVARLGDS